MIIKRVKDRDQGEYVVRLIQGIQQFTLSGLHSWYATLLMENMLKIAMLKYEKQILKKYNNELKINKRLDNINTELTELSEFVKH